MNDEHKISHSQPQPSSHLTVPVSIIALMLVLIFLGGVYFDHHSGWFDPQVYQPYTSAEELAAYQPLSGEAAIAARGKQVYDTICATCHGPDGMGKPGQAPPLAGSEWVNAKGFKRVTEIPLRGLNGAISIKGQNWNASMAAMGAQLSDSDLAAVMTYVRTSWGNKGEAVTADDVKSVRAALSSHAAIGGEQELKTISE
jgi:mono/diheme cytochrome c family protein